MVLVIYGHGGYGRSMTTRAGRWLADLVEDTPIKANMSCNARIAQVLTSDCLYNIYFELLIVLTVCTKILLIGEERKMPMSAQLSPKATTLDEDVFNIETRRDPVIVEIRDECSLAVP